MKICAPEVPTAFSVEEEKENVPKVFDFAAVTLDASFVLEQVAVGTLKDPFTKDATVDSIMKTLHEPSRQCPGTDHAWVGFRMKFPSPSSEADETASGGAGGAGGAGGPAT